MNPSESSYRGFGATPRGPFQTCFNLSDPSSRNNGSGGPLQHQHLFQVVTDPLQPEVTSIARPSHITAAVHPIVALQSTEHPFHGPADPMILLRFSETLITRRGEPGFLPMVGKT